MEFPFVSSAQCLSLSSPLSKSLIMKRFYFQSIKNTTQNLSLPISEAIEWQAFDEKGLIPEIAQDVDTKVLLKISWINRPHLR